MPRRRRKAFPIVPLLLLVLVGGLAAAAWYAPSGTWDALVSRFAPDRSAAPVATPPPAPARPAAAPAFDVCALVDASALGRALGGGVPAARHVGAGADVPAAGACTWNDGPRSLSVLLFTRDSRAAGGDIADGAQYYASVLTGLEYEFKDLPRVLTGIGDAAAIGGFGAGAPTGNGEGVPPQLVFRRGDIVVQLIARGYDAGRTEAAARVIAAGL
jgi:hypothetical protein